MLEVQIIRSIDIKMRLLFFKFQTVLQWKKEAFKNEIIVFINQNGWIYKNSLCYNVPRENI